MPKVLIVDDERANLTATRIYLNARNPGNDILTAQSVADALDIITDNYQSETPVDVLLTDLVMKTSRDGIDLIHKARVIDPSIVCILFTANEKNLDRTEAFHMGAFEVIEKSSFGKNSQEEIAIKVQKAIDIRESRDTYSFLRKYFDPEVAQLIEKDRSAIALKQKTLTIVFWDIRGFSKLCEILKESPQSISGFLDEFMLLSSKTISKHSGILDKFMGDGVMALFGFMDKSEDESDESACRAVEAAIELKQGFQELAVKWSPRWMRVSPEKIDIKLGCGIHTGSVLSGEIGGKIRTQFTAIGPHVNFTARIEGKALNGEIVISQSTKVRIDGKYTIEFFSTEENIKNIPGKFNLFAVDKK